MIRRRRRAYTLVEMVVSLGVLSLVMGSLASIMVLMSRALPSSDDPSTSVVAAERFAAQFASDVETATLFTVVTETQVSFSVPDRDNDGDEEKLSYTWGGGSAPVSRTLNSGASETLLESVGSLAFQYDGIAGASGETELHSGPARAVSGSLSDDQVWYALRINPTIADGASWTLTRAEILLRKSSGTTGNVPVIVRDDKSGSIASSDLVRTSIPISSIGTSWAKVSVDLNAGPFASDDACWIIVAGSNGSGSKEIGGTTSKGSTDVKVSTDGGDNWSSISADLCIDAFGTADSKSGKIERVVLTVVPLAGNETTIRTAVEVLNKPEMGG